MLGTITKNTPDALSDVVFVDTTATSVALIVVTQNYSCDENLLHHTDEGGKEDGVRGVRGGMVISQIRLYSHVYKQMICISF